jgi:hypothetical protein
MDASNVSVMDAYELTQHLEGTQGVKCYASFKDGLINVAQCDDLNTDKVLVHESIHQLITELFNSGLSFRFDRDLIYNFELCKNGIFKDIPIREAFYGILEDICFL